MFWVIVCTVLAAAGLFAAGWALFRLVRAAAAARGRHGLPPAGMRAAARAAGPRVRLGAGKRPRRRPARARGRRRNARDRGSGPAAGAGLRVRGVCVLQRMLRRLRIKDRSLFRRVWNGTGIADDTGDRARGHLSEPRKRLLRAEGPHGAGGARLPSSGPSP